ncbi:DUF6207 family protein [Streptomyces sp. NPDC005381]|uniref:DUF6207 family protein n=1 Tax=Streptomyces sp. NPDC005381 TaxID=3364714 RepID=UPI00369B71AB
MAFQDAVAWTWAPATADVTREPGPGVRIRLYIDLRQALPGLVEAAESRCPGCSEAGFVATGGSDGATPSARARS